MSSSLRHLIWSVFGVLLFAFAVGLFCQEAGLNVLMLRAESGRYLEAAQTVGAERAKFIAEKITSSYSGHFTPIAFWLELEQSRIFNTHSERWFGRQMLAVGVLGLSIVWLLARVGRTQGLRWEGATVGVGAALLYIFQPATIEMAMWPFMVMQFVCLTGMACAASFFVRYTQTHKERDFVGFVLCAYATMHAFGVGASISVAALAIGFVLAVLQFHMGLLDRRRLFRLLGWLAVATILTTAHGYMMVSLPDQVEGESVDAAVSIMRFGMLFVDSLFGGMRSLWANGGYGWPRNDVLWTQGAYGLSLFWLSFIAVLSLAVRYRKSRDSADLIAFGLTGFPLLSFAIYVILIVYRIRTDHGDMAIAPFLIGSRYLVFPSFFIIVLGAGVFVYVARSFSRTVSALMLIAGGGALISSYVFFITLSPTLWPHLHLNHQAAWDRVVETAKMDIALGRPIKNMSFATYDQDFKSDLKFRRHLLERSLRCRGCVRFEGE